MKIKLRRHWQIASSRCSYWRLGPVWELHDIEMADASEMAPHIDKPAEPVQIDSGHETLLVLQAVFIDVYVHATTKLRKRDFVNLFRV